METDRRSTLAASLRRLLPCPPGRPGRPGRRPPAAPGPPTAALPSAEDEAQAQALCDLLTDPQSRITRVRVVGAPAGLLSAVERAAAARGVPAGEAPAGQSARKR
ncbi:MAG TPA: hypothetical protein VNK05_01395 [Chloroflexota bacterium]|nr:hypothetical protein [Chloroflexota bacterium]